MTGRSSSARGVREARLRGAAAPRRALLASTLLAALAAPSAVASLDVAAQKRIRGATFEVVMRKPEQDSLSYEKPLPMELIPFQQRNDKYRSIGTAFATGPNQFVSAAHVVGFMVGSQMGAPRLRSASGEVFEIDRVLKYSDHEDYVVFTLRDPPRVQPLAVNRKPRLNEAVYAVGNALGEGIVIRDGLLTSETPEPLEGRWKFLRFSAAASPGNSGGPLLDDAARVIGIVARKSPGENLNMAVPIDLALAGPSRATSEVRSSISLPFMPDVRETVSFNEGFDLPLDWPAFAAARQALMLEQFKKQRDTYLAKHADKVFPAGEGSARVLYSLNAPDTVGTLRRGSDGNWVQGGSGGQRIDIGRNGYIEVATPFMILRRPDDVDPAALRSDDKLFMDTLLKGMQMKRMIGSDGVRVTSLGAPREKRAHKDRWGRTWEIRSWHVEHNDSIVTTYALATPQGFLVMQQAAPTGFAQLVSLGALSTLDYTGLSLTGTLAQWQEYLQARPSLPDALEGVSIRFLDGRLEYRSPQLSFEVPPSTLKLTPESVLTVQPSFVPSLSGVEWKIARVALRPVATEPAGLFVSRRLQPPDSLPESVRNDWKRIAAREHPWTALPYAAGDVRRIATTIRLASAGADAPVYTVEYVREPYVDDSAMTKHGAQLFAGVRVLETAGVAAR